MSKNRPGLLSVLSLTDEETQNILEYSTKLSGNDSLDILYGIFPDQWLKFIDLFSGETFKVPTREAIYKNIAYIKIYTYCKARDYSDLSIDTMAKLYGRRRNAILNIIKKVEAILSKPNVGED